MTFWLFTIKGTNYSKLREPRGETYGSSISKRTNAFLICSKLLPTDGFLKYYI